MQGASLTELRDLSLWSRRTQRVGLLGILAIMVAIPAQLLFGAWLAAAPAGAIVLSVAGVAFVAYAFAAGRERGAFRRVFRRIADDKRLSRAPEKAVTIVPIETP